MKKSFDHKLFNKNVKNKMTFYRKCIKLFKNWLKKSALNDLKQHKWGMQFNIKNGNHKTKQNKYLQQKPEIFNI